MKFDIRFTATALDHLRHFRKSEQRIIVDVIKKQLSDEPLSETRNRKTLRQNPLSRWELRVRKFRVFYEVDADNRIVEIKAVGYKIHNQLFIANKRFEL